MSHITWVRTPWYTLLEVAPMSVTETDSYPNNQVLLLPLKYTLSFHLDAMVPEHKTSFLASTAALVVM